jgi:membrane protein implicated in regulation of membrane protease activity
MTWNDFYLVCFALGFIFSLLSFVLGGVHWHGLHIHVGQHHVGGHVGGHGTGHGPHVSFFNPVTLAAFLAWFGGMGYLLTRFSGIGATLAFGAALFAGMLAAAVMFFFLTRVLMSKDENLDASDFEMTGVLGKTSVSIREGGTGEIIYSQGGTRRTCGARSENGNAIPKGTEVMVTRYENGLAYVRLWSELVEDELSSADKDEQS